VGEMDNRQTWEKDTEKTEHLVEHDGQSTRKIVMKDTKSSVVKKKPDEESDKLRDIARKQRQKHETQANRKKNNPVETMRRRKVEQRLPSKEQILNKVEGQHKVKKTYKGV
jgi:hypothetical protein